MFKADRDKETKETKVVLHEEPFFSLISFWQLSCDYKHLESGAFII